MSRGLNQFGLKLAELGILAGGIDDATLCNRVRRFEAAQIEDPELKRLVEQTLKYLEKGKMWPLIATASCLSS